MAAAEYANKYAPFHILVDEDAVDEVLAVVNANGFWVRENAAAEAAAEEVVVTTDTPDKAGLVALSWTGGDWDPAWVVDRIRRRAESLSDMVAPDHTVGIDVRPDTGEIAASAEMGGPASPASLATEQFPDREAEPKAGRGVIVGVVDSGIVRHPWFDGAYIASPGSVDPLDEDPDGELDAQAGHGTFITGLILQQAPGATVHMIRAFDKDGFVRVRTAARAVVELDQRGADVINLSFGGYTRKDKPPLAHRKAFSKVRDSTVIVAAAGNHNPDQPEQVAMKGRVFYPAAMDRVVSVAAIKQGAGGQAELARFSNHGPWVTIAAVGENVHSTFVEFGDFRGWATWSGTSFAAPIVAGRIAAAMTDDGEIVRSAEQAKKEVFGRATIAPGLTAGADPAPVIRHQDPAQ